jgi:hypothetical protein
MSQTGTGICSICKSQGTNKSTCPDNPAVSDKANYSKHPNAVSKPKPVAKPTTKAVSKPVAKPVSKPVAKPVSKPVSKPVAKPIAKPIAKPVAKPIAKPVAKAKAKPKPTSFTSEDRATLDTLISKMRSKAMDDGEEELLINDRRYGSSKYFIALTDDEVQTYIELLITLAKSIYPTQERLTSGNPINSDKLSLDDFTDNITPDQELLYVILRDSINEPDVPADLLDKRLQAFKALPIDQIRLTHDYYLTQPVRALDSTRIAPDGISYESILLSFDEIYHSLLIKRGAFASSCFSNYNHRMDMPWRQGDKCDQGINADMINIHKSISSMPSNLVSRCKKYVDTVVMNTNLINELDYIRVQGLHNLSESRWTPSDLGLSKKDTEFRMKFETDLDAWINLQEHINIKRDLDYAPLSIQEVVIEMHKTKEIFAHLGTLTDKETTRLDDINVFISINAPSIACIFNLIYLKLTAFIGSN